MFSATIITPPYLCISHNLVSKMHVFRRGDLLRRLSGRAVRSSTGGLKSITKSQKRFYSEPSPQTPLEFFNQVRSDLETFPEYFNPVTYVLFAAIMAYLLFITSNGRGRSFILRNFSLDTQNISKGRLHTILTHSLLETSAITLLMNCFMLRWGGNIVLNMGGGNVGFWRAIGLLSLGPGCLYSVVSGFWDKQAKGQDWLEVGKAVVPTSHFKTQSVSGLHAVSAGLVANGILQLGAVYGRKTTAVPILASLYLLLAVGGSTDSWLALSGITTAVLFRGITKRGF